ncbi:MAG: nucleoside hydrolase-like domain-containing protein, partial [Planctomycetota bacterium]
MTLRSTILWARFGVLAYAVAALFCLSSAGSDKLRVIMETDAPGGDPDDEGSLVRFFLYLNEWDVEGMIGTRSATQSRTGVDGKTTINQYIDAYQTVLPKLTTHAQGWPTVSYLRSITKQCYTGTEGRDLVIAAVDKNDPRPIWFTNWGTNEGNTTALRQALDYVKTNRTAEEYKKFIGKIMYVEVYNQNHIGTDHRDALSFYMDTFWPDMDGGRWYHRFSPLTATAGGFNIDTDVKTNHGSLCAKYTITKEGDTPTFMHLIPNGLNVPGHPNYGSWSGRYAYGSIFSGCRAIWACNQRDTWSGSTNRDNTLKPWAVHLQNDFKVRADWCVASSFSGANHPPSVVLNGDSSQDMLRFFARPGAVISLNASGSSDPDGNSLTYFWRYYKEAGSYTGSVAIENTAAQTTSFTVPADADGKDIHIILQVTDNGGVPLTRYRRMLIKVRNTLKIMPLGDSLTDGSHNGIYAGSYRVRLEQLMNAEGWTWDFVGSKQNGSTNGLVDQHHEGWIGYWTKDAPSGQYDIATDINLNTKLTTYQPDIVLLLIGANDCIHGTAADVAAAPKKIGELVEQMRQSVNSETEIFIGTLTPSTDTTRDTRFKQVNAALPEIQAIKDGMGRNVTLVDLYPALNKSIDLADTVHYNASGSSKVGQVWFNSIKPLVYSNGDSSPVITTTTLPAGTQGQAYSATLLATGGNLPLTWSLASGSLPGGLTLTGNTISGSPTGAGTTNFRVRVVDSDSDSNERDFSIIISVAVPSAPSNLVATTASSSQINLTWNDNSSNETGFRIERSTGGSGELAVTIANYAGGNTAPTIEAAGTTNSFQAGALQVNDRTETWTTVPTELNGKTRLLCARDDKGATGYNTLYTVTLSAPADVYAIVSPQYATSPMAFMDGTWTLTAQTARSSSQSTDYRIWKKSANAGSLVLGADNDSAKQGACYVFIGGSAWETISTVSANATSYNNSGLTASTTYSYRIIALNAGGESSASNTATATTQSGGPSNNAPTVDAGADQSITLPVDTVNLNGTVTDPDNTPATLWSFVSGPGSVAFGNPNAVDTTAAFTTAGVYVLRLEANDGVNSAVSDTVTITVNAEPTELIVSVVNVKSGKSYQIDTLSVGKTCYIDRAFTFNAVPSAYVGLKYIRSANDDKSSTVLDFLTLSVNQDVTVFVAFDARSVPPVGWLQSWTATGDSIGTTDVSRIVYSKPYPAGQIVLGGNKPSAAGSMYNVIIRGEGGVSPNVPPVVNAGVDQTLTLPSNNVFIDGSVVDPDSVPNVLWNKTSGPGTVSFGNASSAQTTATFSAAGVYVLTLTANDGINAPVSDTVQITVNPEPSNTPPSVDAGVNQTITLPTNTVNLDATVTDPDNTPTMLWTGPAGVSFANASAVDTVATFNAAGAYLLTLTADDGINAPVSDSVLITVNEAPSGEFVVQIISVSSGKSYQLDTLSNGKLCYIDRSYTFKDVPSELIGGALVRTANDDKNSSGDMFLTVTINQPATAYVLFDYRSTTVPGWLSSWTLESFTVGSTDIKRLVYSKHFDAGAIVFGGNKPSVAGSMYNVALISDSKSVSVLLKSPVSMEKSPMGGWFDNDWDGDGLTDLFEISYGLNMLSIDTNADETTDEHQIEPVSGLTYYELQ